LLWTYDFSNAIDRAQSRSLFSLDGSHELSVKLIPLEDLLLSKMWPYFESSMVLDLALLLRFAVSKQPFDSEYFAARLNSGTQEMREQCFQNLARFRQTLQKSPILDALADETLYRSIELLEQAFRLAEHKNGSSPAF
jgi:hypothetical protein